MKKRLITVLKLFDDDSVKEKLTVMTKWDAMIDDSRNAEIDDPIERFLRIGHAYQVTIEDLGSIRKHHLACI